MIVIVTRPAQAGRRLFSHVVEHGHDAIWWPAFEIGPAPDPDAVRDALRRLSDYGLAIFVSASAVSATRAFLQGAWPAHTMIGAVGPSTHAAVTGAPALSAGSIVVAPSNAGDSGSESFWNAWRATARSVQKVLLLRAAEGRDWLTEQFVESGAQVDAVAVYSRVPQQLSAADLARLEGWVARHASAVPVFSSTEAVAALDAQVGDAGKTWLRLGTAIACHPRIAQQLRSNGYARVLDATFDDDSIIAKLESIRAS